MAVDDLLFWPSLNKDARDGRLGEALCENDAGVVYGEFGCSRRDLVDSGPTLVLARGRWLNVFSDGFGKFSDEDMLSEMLVDEGGIACASKDDCTSEWLFLRDRSKSRKARIPMRPLLRFRLDDGSPTPDCEPCCDEYSLGNVTVLLIASPQCQARFTSSAWSIELFADDAA